ncbi:EAL and HDOD domain-containing protein [Desulfobacula phenolica]|uniref:EAL and modified HD-GYP domain-containing signal transduction protein n=1 Tax=Desulfobacula phenolica TaxID=90732 RepID=A0A1H2ITD4_9BACT|nr:HDOD domain-containing protein [Desulfobacula phenolica]SDU47427.1 EAL and modified HD-GYP domain-containing signal transduction protein [Desulfobacula phenolica]
MDIFVARQPVFTAQKKLWGYELLFRLGFKNAFPDIDGDVATSNVLANTFFSFEIKEILGNKPGLINFTKELILQKTPLLFPQQHFIIEVLENIEPDREILLALKEFHEKGFKIALDDFVYHEKFIPMMEMCDIIKFDLMATPLETLTGIVKDIRSNYSITLLAEKVETYEEFELAKDMGFDLFQGYFFSRPEILSKKEISSSQITKLKLINEVGKKELDIKKIESLIKKDVSVSFKLLKFINSAYFARPTPINTIKDAITYLGMEELRKFINIIAVSDLSESKPNELIRSSVIRARLCEQFGTVFKTHFTTEELFTLGLFSVMDAMLDIKMKDVLKNITFSEKIKDGLLGKDKEFKKILKIVVSLERGEWDNNFYTLIAGKSIEKKLPQFYLDAIQMVNSFLS